MADAPEPDGSRWAGLHPRIYATMVVLAAGFAVAAWGFAGGGFSRMEVGVVSLFVVVITGLLTAIAHIRRRQARAMGADDAGRAGAFRDWASGQFETYGGLVKGRLAMIEALLPIIAVVALLVALAIVKSVAS